MIGVQIPIAEMQALLYSTRRAVGAAGEVIVAKALEGTGYYVDNSHPEKRGDIQAYTRRGKGFTVEVKTARANARGRYCFTLVKEKKSRVKTKKPAGFKADHRGSDWTVLVCVQKSGNPVVFVIPTGDIRDNRSIEIPADPVGYSGKYSKYRQNIRFLTLA